MASGLLAIIGLALHPAFVALEGGLVTFGFKLEHTPGLEGAGSVAWLVTHSLLLVALLCGMLGLVALYARRVGEIGCMGLWGFLLAFSGEVFLFSKIYYSAFVYPVLVTKAPAFVEKYGDGASVGILPFIFSLGPGLVALGFTLFGISLLRARVSPRWATWLMVGGALTSGVGPVLPHVVGLVGPGVFGLGIMGLGYGLWAEKGSELG